MNRKVPLFSVQGARKLQPRSLRVHYTGILVWARDNVLIILEKCKWDPSREWLECFWMMQIKICFTCLCKYTFRSSATSVHFNPALYFGLHISISFWNFQVFHQGNGTGLPHTGLLVSSSAATRVVSSFLFQAFLTLTNIWVFGKVAHWVGASIEHGYSVCPETSL